MKFTRYLEDTQIPEWKRAYIDYRLFKERLRAIRQAMHDGALYPVDSYSNSQLGHHGAASMLSVIKSESGENSSEESFSMNMPMETSRRDLAFQAAPNPPRLRLDVSGPSIRPPLADRRPSFHRTLTSQSNPPPPSPGGIGNASRNPRIVLPQLVVRQPTNRSHLVPPSPGGETVTTGGRLARINSNHCNVPSMDQYLTSAAATEPRRTPQPHESDLQKCLEYDLSIVDPLRRHPYAQLSMHQLVPLLSPHELSFFIALDEQVFKVETFYQDRQKIMKTRNQELELQLRELNEHRRRFDAANSEPSPGWRKMLNPLSSRIRALVNLTSKPAANTAEINSTDSKPHGEFVEGVHFDERLDPEKYLAAKRKLKKAVMEHYRALGMLNNYRILNIYATQRVLAKFEKTTKVSVLIHWLHLSPLTKRRFPLNEHTWKKRRPVEPTVFYSDDTLRVMMEELQHIYAVTFERGSTQKAFQRLRAGIQYKSHHNSTFCSGIAIGSALAAFGSGVAYASQKSTRDSIPGWDGLLFIFGVFLVPVLFALLIGFNLLAWSRNRINYTFIFELDLRTRLDHREYWQLPSVLLAGLSYAFWLSFSRTGAPMISPTLWPAIWLGCTAALLIDPFPLLFKSSRYWLIKNTAKLLRSGLRRVEFTDFWLGDQFCSLVFPLSNIPLVVCVYSHGLDSDWRKCGNSSNLWPLNFVLAILPFLVRFVQSVKRYADSKVHTHLINAGKYGAGCVAQFCYILWRHHGSHYDATFAMWIITNTFATSYALAWDFLMDWSVLRLHVRHKLLRQDLIYTHTSLYYVAIVLNTLLRFLWILYIPAGGPDAMLRSFIVGVLEIVRRWQWNFYRLENEQIGNADQYRATREVPLPYATRRDVEEDDEGSEIDTKDA
ncbi:Signal transduction protein [Mycena indigotica]|uniref:Signal transduction protein n=1 Tax=Mycena indigotica TaxID=2126181 RepID=A0A8H6WGS6_9AGAR|nr:Signal transduction protein [Mycena indigotica]KAF7316201.1 Signal transduction protein [Mycena indigotica]